MKKIIAWLLLMLVCVNIISCGSTKGLQYSISKDASYVVVSDIDRSVTPTSLVIPAEHNGLPVKAIGSKVGWARTTCADVTKISLPDGLLCIDTSFYATAFYEDESNWETETIDGVTCKALYIDGYLICVEPVMRSSSFEGSVPFTVKEGTKGIASRAFRGDWDYVVHIPNSGQFIGSALASDGVSIETGGELTLHGYKTFRVVFDGTVAEWESMNKDLASAEADSVMRIDDISYDGSDIESHYFLYIVNCKDGSLVYDS